MVLSLINYKIEGVTFLNSNSTLAAYKEQLIISKQKMLLREEKLMVL